MSILSGVSGLVYPLEAWGRTQWVNRFEYKTNVLQISNFILMIEEVARLEARISWEEFSIEGSFWELSFEFVTNTPEEVVSAIRKMNDCLNKNWIDPDTLSVLVSCKAQC